MRQETTESFTAQAESVNAAAITRLPETLSLLIESPSRPATSGGSTRPAGRASSPSTARCHGSRFAISLWIGRWRVPAADGT